MDAHPVVPFCTQLGFKNHIPSGKVATHMPSRSAYSASSGKYEFPSQSIGPILPLYRHDDASLDDLCLHTVHILIPVVRGCQTTESPTSPSTETLSWRNSEAQCRYAIIMLDKMQQPRYESLPDNDDVPIRSTRQRGKQFSLVVLLLSNIVIACLGILASWIVFQRQPLKNPSLLWCKTLPTT